MNVKTLNEKQTQWAVKLIVFDFVILHKSDKINFVNASLRCSDYIKIINENIDKFLLTLQKKLTTMSTTISKSLMIISYLEIVCQTCEEWINIRFKESQLN